MIKLKTIIFILGFWIFADLYLENLVESILPTQGIRLAVALGLMGYAYFIMNGRGPLLKRFRL